MFTPKIAAALLKDGKAKVKGLYSMKTGKTYDGTVLLADNGGKYVNYRVEHRSYDTNTASIGGECTPYVLFISTQGTSVFQNAIISVII